MKKTENNKRVFARKVATKVALTEKEMQKVNGGHLLFSYAGGKVVFGDIRH